MKCFRETRESLLKMVGGLEKRWWKSLARTGLQIFGSQKLFEG